MKNSAIRTIATLMAVIAVLMCIPVSGMQTLFFSMKALASDDVVELNGHYYKVFGNGTVSTWEEAVEYCESLGGYMATISSDQENRFLYNYIRDMGYTNAYFGYSDSTKENYWKWVKSEGSSYTNWNSGEPNNQGNEDYAMFYWSFGDGTWNDGDFQGYNTEADTLSFICEWESLSDMGDNAPKDYRIKVVNSYGDPLSKISVKVIRGGTTQTYITDRNGNVTFRITASENFDFTVNSYSYSEYSTVGTGHAPNENGVEVVVLYSDKDGGIDGGHHFDTVITKATLTKNGKKELRCEECGLVLESSVIYRPKTVKLSAKTYTYTGKTKTPLVSVKDSNGNTLSENTDYKVSYPKKRKDFGKYTVTVKFKGKYSGKKKLTFTIAPAKASITKLVSGTKKITAKWKKVNYATGYELQYSTSKKFTGKTTKTVKTSSETTKKILKKLKGGKKYYVRIRAYKTVGDKKILGLWSNVKSKKTK